MTVIGRHCDMYLAQLHGASPPQIINDGYDNINDLNDPLLGGRVDTNTAPAGLVAKSKSSIGPTLCQAVLNTVCVTTTSLRL
jgi:hypothetical protein